MNDLRHDDQILLNLQLLEFKSLNNDKLGSATRAVDQSIERVSINVDWMNNYYNQVSEWMKKQVI